MTSLTALGLAAVLGAAGVVHYERRVRIAAQKGGDTERALSAHNTAMKYLHEHNIKMAPSIKEAETFGRKVVEVDAGDLEAQLRVVHIQYNLAGLNRDELRFTEAAERFRQVLERLSRLELEGRLEGQAAVELRYLNTLKQEIVYCEQAPRVLELPAVVRSQPPVIAVRLLLLRVRLLAERGRRPEIAATAEELLGFKAEELEEPIWLARALASCVPHLDERRGPRRGRADRAVAALSLSLAAARGLHDVTSIESDDALAPVRQHPGYRELIDRLRHPGSSSGGHPDAR